MIRTISPCRICKRFVGAVASDPGETGRLISEFYPEECKRIDIPVSASLKECLASPCELVEVVLLQTGSHLKTNQAKLEQAMKAGINVVAASEVMHNSVLR